MTTSRGFYTSGAYTEHYLGIRWPREIWGAVLAQAVKDATEGPADFEVRGMSAEAADNLRGDIRAAAQHWIADDANEPRRFVWVCEQLGVSPDAVRRSIERRKT